ncbi:hypothetical protein ACTMU2_41550 [Cupriavidus basilensis]
MIGETRNDQERPEIVKQVRSDGIGSLKTDEIECVVAEHGQRTDCNGPRTSQRTPWNPWQADEAAASQPDSRGEQRRQFRKAHYGHG